MNSTSASLLRRLQQPDQEQAWQRFVDLYAPLIFYWGKNHGLNAADAADLVQDVLAILIDKLPEFQYDPKRRFRGWLQTITRNRATDLYRRNAAQPQSGRDDSIQNVSVAAAADLFDETEYRRFVVARALQVMQAEFPAHAWQACWQLAVEGRRGADVAADLGISESTVYTSKCRILRRLRVELKGLLE